MTQKNQEVNKVSIILGPDRFQTCHMNSELQEQPPALGPGSPLWALLHTVTSLIFLACRSKPVTVLLKGLPWLLVTFRASISALLTSLALSCAAASLAPTSYTPYVLSSIIVPFTLAAPLAWPAS